MINQNKSTSNFETPQIAGLFPSDNNVEFVGNRETKKAMWLQNGSIHYFTDLPLELYNLVKNEYLSNPKAVEFCSQIHDELRDQVELFTYYMYGDLDATPDIANGVLSVSENFRDSRNCPSLLWNSKNITIDNYILSARCIVMLDMMADDYKDTVIAEAVGVSYSYYNELKKALFTKTNTNSKPALLIKAKAQNVI